jgi:hypothetical protein
MKIKKFILATTTVLTLSVCSLQPAITASASSQSIAVEQSRNSVTPRSDYKTWMYKVENGKIYKRLYNCSTGVWIGDWIYVGEYTGD